MRQLNERKSCSGRLIGWKLGKIMLILVSVMESCVSGNNRMDFLIQRLKLPHNAGFSAHWRVFQVLFCKVFAGLSMTLLAVVLKKCCLGVNRVGLAKC